MKSKPLALAIASIAFATCVNADPVVYGKMFVTLQAINDQKSGADIRDNYELLSNASRLGVQGSTKLTNTLNAIYKAEYEIAVDGDEFSASDSNGDSYSQTLKQRNIYIGLQGGFGTLIAGKNDTPTKLAFVKIDRFNDYLYGDVRHVLVGRNRENDIVMYSTPAMKGFSVTIAFQPGEAKSNATPPDSYRNDVGDGWSGALNYINGGLTVALTGDYDIQYTDLVRLIADYKFGNFDIGGMVQTAEQRHDQKGIGKIEAPMSALGATFEEQDGFVLGADYTMGKWKLKAQYAESTSDEWKGLGDVEIDQISLGIDYKLAEKTIIITYYTDVEADEDFAAPNIDAASDTFGLGIVHDF